MRLFKKKKEEIQYGQLASLPYVFYAKNNSDKIEKCILFPVERGVDGELIKNPKCIEISMGDENSSYEGFLKELITSPFISGMMYIQSANSIQVFKPIKYLNHKNTGEGYYSTIRPRLDPMQNQSGVTVIRHNAIISSSTQLSFDILPNTTVVMSLYPQKQTRIENLLKESIDVEHFSRPEISQLIYREPIKKTFLQYVKSFFKRKQK